MTIRLEWKPEDMWIGAFWRRGQGRIDIWICVVPMLPIHIIHWRNTGLEINPRTGGE